MVYCIDLYWYKSWVETKISNNKLNISFIIHALKRHSWFVVSFEGKHVQDIQEDTIYLFRSSQWECIHEIVFENENKWKN